MSNNSKYDLEVIHSLDEIPDFKTEDEEREWWANHEMSDELWDSLPDMTAELDEILPLPNTPRTRKRAG